MDGGRMSRVWMGRRLRGRRRERRTCILVRSEVERPVMVGREKVNLMIDITRRFIALNLRKDF